MCGASISEDATARQVLTRRAVNKVEEAYGFVAKYVVY